MAHLSIDDHVFDFVKRNPLESSTYTTTGAWIVVDAIEAPIQIPTTQALDDWDLNVVAYKGDGAAEADALRAMAKIHKPVMVTDGTGKSWGQFTIQSVTTQYTKIVEKGIAQVVKITIKLKEWRQNESHSKI